MAVVRESPGGHGLLSPLPSLPRSSLRNVPSHSAACVLPRKTRGAADRGGALPPGCVAAPLRPERVLSLWGVRCPLQDDLERTPCKARGAWHAGARGVGHLSPGSWRAHCGRLFLRGPGLAALHLPTPGGPSLPSSGPPDGGPPSSRGRCRPARMCLPEPALRGLAHAPPRGLAHAPLRCPCTSPSAVPSRRGAAE